MAALGRIFADRLLRSGVLTEEEAAQLPVDARPRPVDHRVDHPAPGAVVLRWTWWFQKGEPVSEDYSIQFYIQIISIYIYIADLKKALGTYFGRTCSFSTVTLHSHHPLKILGVGLFTLHRF